MVWISKRIHTAFLRGAEFDEEDAAAVAWVAKDEEELVGLL
jgi:hypothetical protein